MIIVGYITIDMKTDVNFNKIVCLWFLWNSWYYDNERFIISVLSSQLPSPYSIKTSSGFDKGLERSRATELLKVIDKTVTYFHALHGYIIKLGSVQVLYKQVFPNTGPPPLNKQNKHDLRPTTPPKMLI